MQKHAKMQKHARYIAETLTFYIGFYDGMIIAHNTIVRQILN